MSGGVDGEQINRALGLFEDSIIENLSIDIVHNRITIQTRSESSSGDEHHTATFEGVASNYVVRGAKEARFNHVRADQSPDDMTAIGDCDGIGYSADGIGQVQIHARPGSWESKWVRDFDTRPNFLITIGDTIILLEARLVRIDGTAFAVGYAASGRGDEV